MEIKMVIEFVVDNMENKSLSRDQFSIFCGLEDEMLALKGK